MLVIVGCGAKKASRRTRADRLYRGQLFTAAMDLANAIVEPKWEQVMIASAKHRLIRCEEVIEPYEVTMRSLGKGGRETWSDEMAKAVQEWGDGGERVVVLAAAEYVDGWKDQVDIDLGRAASGDDPGRATRMDDQGAEGRGGARRAQGGRAPEQGSDEDLRDDGRAMARRTGDGPMRLAKPAAGAPRRAEVRAGDQRRPGRRTSSGVDPVGEVAMSFAVALQGDPSRSDGPGIGGAHGAASTRAGRRGQARGRAHRRSEHGRPGRRAQGALQDRLGRLGGSPGSRAR